MLPPQNQTNAASGSKHVVIMGCGRIGASVATVLAERGHTLHILDIDLSAFSPLPTGMIGDGRILPILGDGTLEVDLRMAATQDADMFIAASGKDALNALAGQIARHILQVPTVICRINEPTRKEMYSRLGLITISATSLVTEMVLEAAGS